MRTSTRRILENGTQGASMQREAPSPTEAAAAAEALTALRGLQPSGDAGPVRLGRPGGDPVLVPAAAFRLFLEVLEEMAEGNLVTVVPVGAELTSQQAADFLNVSRPFVVKLLDEGRIPYRRVGNRRRVLFSDLAAYKRQDDADRERVAASLAAEAQALGLGY